MRFTWWVNKVSDTNSDSVILISSTPTMVMERRLYDNFLYIASLV